MKGWIAFAVLIGFVLWRSGCATERDAVQDAQEKEVIRVTDTVYRVTRDTLRVVRTHTDSILQTDTVFHRDTVEKIVRAERNACDDALRACDARVASRDQRIATLEKRQAARLYLYGRGGLTLPKGPPLVEAEAGIALRLDRDLYLQGATNQRGELRVLVEKRVRLFK